MENNILLNQAKEEYFEFDLEVSGLNVQNAQARFVIQSEPFCMSFPCKDIGNNRWALQLPKLFNIEASTYKFSIEAIIDGYFFEAHTGIVTIIKSADVYVRTSDADVKVRNTAPAPAATPATTPAAIGPVAPSAEPAVTITPVSIDVTNTNTLDHVKDIINRLKSPPTETPPVAAIEIPVVNDDKKEIKDEEKDKKEDKKKDKKEDKKQDKEVKDTLKKAKEVADALLKTPAKKTEESVDVIDDKAERIKQIIKDSQITKQPVVETVVRVSKEKPPTKKAATRGDVTITPEPIVEAVVDLVKDDAAKAILESIKKSEPAVEIEAKSVMFKKAGVVVK